MSYIDLNEVQVFVSVVRAGGFSKAAQAIGVPKSTLSRKVSDLESRIGVTLLHRTTRQLRLTTAGEKYYQTCLIALESIQFAETQVIDDNSDDKGLIKISTPAEMGDQFAKLIHGFKVKYPRINFEINMTDIQVDLLKDGYDLVFRVGKLEDSQFKSKKLGVDQFIFVAAPAYLKKHPKINDVKDLEEHQLIIFSPTLEKSKVKISNEGRQFEIKNSSFMKINSAQFCKKLAQFGSGVAFVPEMIVKKLVQENELVQVLPGWHGHRSSIHLVFHSEKKISNRLRKFIDFVSENYITIEN